MYSSEKPSEQEDYTFSCHPVLKKELQDLFRQTTCPAGKGRARNKRRKLLLNAIEMTLKYPTKQKSILRMIEKQRSSQL